MAPADKMRGGEPANLILEGTRLEGDLHFTTQLVVAGLIKGNIRCESMLIIERGGRVEGRIEAPVIIVHGELEGTVLATQSIEIWSGARVAGDVAARSVRVDEGSMLTANLLIAADLPDRLGPPDPQSEPAPASTAGRDPVQSVTPPATETRPATPMSPPASFLSPGPARG
ncbi:polymer-forming cytoskeletal protein [uncultured Hyphomonas sp.]|uniref:bactofilin family protein n=1 Tax=uncultured Hyphomonas sp. TaxID=225298 RepID=UPI002AABCC0C|nr:polymer-forming cytoskeletal protein [uncultured Hyphomonas sp.]